MGYDEATIGRVQAIVTKERLRDDPEVQTLEDALALVFVETQFTELADRLDDDHMVDVVVRTLRKMTPAGREAASSSPWGSGTPPSSAGRSRSSTRR